MNKLFTAMFALPGVIALILVLILWQRQGPRLPLEIPHSEKIIANPLTAIQQERLTVFRNWVDETDAKVRAIGDGSDYAHDFKIRHLAITKDNYVCGTLWIRPRTSTSKEQIIRYVLPPGDRIKPITVEGNNDKYWDDAGCNAAIQVVAPNN
jgi:hypothetical protein